MIVTDNSKKNASPFKEVFKFWNSLPKLKFDSIPIKFDLKKSALIILITIILWTFLLAAFIYRQSHKAGFKELAFSLNLKGRDEVKHKFMRSVKAVALAPFNWTVANFSNHEIPQIHIDIKFKHFQKLHKKREEALKIGILKQGPDDYVPAKVRHEGKTVKVKLRLKGDQTDHLEGDKWSFRIHLKGDDHLFGMRHFSIQSPRTRNFEGEILFFEALRREGVLVPRYFFVEAAVNGKDIGLMAIEEHFSKELLESQGRKESVIIRFDESKIWEPNTGGVFGNFKVAKITPFRSKKVFQSEKLLSDLHAARGLLRAFVTGTIPASQVFDPDLMGRFIAVADVWRAWHQLGWHNIRFYYNPITALLEPIGYDASIPYKNADVPPAPDEPIVSTILNGSPKIRAAYENTVKKLAQEMVDGTTTGWVKPLAGKQLGILHKEYPLLKGIRFDLIVERAKTTLQRSQAPLSRYPEILQAYSIDTGENLYLELINPLNHAVEIHEIKCIGEAGKKRNINLSTLPPIRYPLYLKLTSKGGLPKAYKIYYKKNKIKGDCKIKVAAKIAGDDLIRWIEVQPYSSALARNPVPQITLPETLAQHPFLKFETGTDYLQIGSGEWRVNNWLIIPEGMELRISKGTTLRFGSSFGLVAGGPIMIQGTQEAPVILTGSGKSDNGNGWQGIVVRKSGLPSKWSHVIIRGTTGISKNGWNLSGGLNFYEADIQMKHVTIIGNQSEDALNIVRSKFELDSVNIKDAVSDAFDSDFSNGVVRGGVYENIGHAGGGGDGIDVSGSEISVTGTVFKNISDKALSVGEQSTMTAVDVSMERVGTAAVSKDNSHLTLTNAKIIQTKTAGLMAYTKKKEYGPGTIVASQLEMQSVASLAVSQKGSRIFIDGEDIEETDLNVKELYATLMKSGNKK
jgi:hypothetical protein